MDPPTYPFEETSFMNGPLSELKVTPSFCFAFKIPDDVTASNTYNVFKIHTELAINHKN